MSNKTKQKLRNKEEAKLLKRNKLVKSLNLAKKNYMLYLFLLPAIIYIAVFSYAPLYGIQIAFKNFNSSAGIWGSPWVGFDWFETFFASPRFWQILWNTISLSMYMLIASFPIPIMLALVLNSIRREGFKRFAQTATYLPHFISTVVLVGMLSSFLSPRSGFVNTLIEPFVGEPIYFLGSEELFSDVYVWSGIWQNMGWSSIIYLAALSGVDPGLHEAAKIDGASRFKRIFYVDLPTIIPTMVILLILSCGSLLNIGFEKVFLMQNPMNIGSSEIISTYTYKLGLLQHQYSYSTAIGLFNNVINFIILVFVNKSAKKLSGTSLW